MKTVTAGLLLLILFITGCSVVNIQFYWNDGIYTLSDTTSSLQFFICHQESDYDDATVAPIHLTIKESSTDSVLLSSLANAVDWDEEKETQEKKTHHFSNATFHLNGEELLVKRLVVQPKSVALYCEKDGKEIIHNLQHLADFMRRDLEAGTYSTSLGESTLSLIYKGDQGSNLRFVYLYGDTAATTDVGVDLWKTGLAVHSGDYVSLRYTYHLDEYSKSSETSNPTHFTFNGIRYSTIHLEMAPKGLLLQAKSYGGNSPLTTLLVKE